MSKIPMIRRNRVFNVDARLAPLLERHGGYLRRDMQAQSPSSLPPDTQALDGEHAAARAKGDAAAAAKVQDTPTEATKKAARKAAKKAVSISTPAKDASE